MNAQFPHTPRRWGSIVGWVALSQSYRPYQCRCEPCRPTTTICGGGPGATKLSLLPLRLNRQLGRFVQGIITGTLMDLHVLGHEFWCPKGPQFTQRAGM